LNDLLGGGTDSSAGFLDWLFSVMHGGAEACVTTQFPFPGGRAGIPVSWQTGKLANWEKRLLTTGALTCLLKKIDSLFP
jgi:hypothetical protein